MIDRAAYDAAERLRAAEGGDAFFSAWDRWLDAIDAQDDTASAFWLRVADALEAIETVERPEGATLN